MRSVSTFGVTVGRIAEDWESQRDLGEQAVTKPERSASHRCPRSRVLLVSAVVSAFPCGYSAVAQSHSPAPVAAPQSFETASLKLAPAGQAGAASISPWGTHQFTAANVSLGVLLSIAYGVDSAYITGVPGKLESASYEVVASAAGNQGLTYEQVHAPLQKLLAERLHLVVHTTTSQVSGYRLVAGKKGATLAPAQDQGEQYAYIFKNEIKAHSITMEVFAGLVAAAVKQPVQDATGVEGKNDFDLHFSSPDQPDSNQPSIMTALEEQYGLRLVSSKVPVLSLVVDHVDLVPAAN
ncbi:TIGR03435 family protein [Acidipila sp. EB88]|uniref:TIGR03435 family protein n=1 Tax=Acidipila sp. EB88 TaxID=2305226 RepID=UPI000F5E3B1E|nr:TIGR03435 family protein [Acidipila sp. EB88]RRA49833.1 TIGR03435 family protein [Acidipila sp. EB88]